ncbi:hypothetical protein [Bacillus sp. REN10]|uniref:hypothetical protein n=1 Tax=Bacillus sp. REN10 TaxID=2782541 RepID=UPI00193AFD05|nr:hypothetical protein [Bacillus sp. REN10]
MRLFFKSLGYFVLLVILTGCARGKEQQATTNSTLTIKPYELTEKEELLISKTGDPNVSFFTLDGKLKKGEDLKFSIEMYENGKFKESLLTTTNEIDNKFNDTIISFSVRDHGPEAKMVSFVAGTPSSVASTVHPNKMTNFSYNTLVEDKIKLKKDKPVYLAIWQGTTKDHFSTYTSENGKLPNLKNAELAFAYKVMLIEK